MDARREFLYYRLMLALQPPQFDTLRINAAPRVYACEPGWNWAPPPLPDHDFWFVVSGRGSLEVRGQKHEICAGSCAVLRPGEAPRAQQDPNHRLTVFFAHFDALNAGGEVTAPLDRGGFEDLVTVRDQNSIVTAAQRIERLWQRGDEFARHQAQLCLGVLVWQIWDESRFSISPADQPFESLSAAIRRAPGRNWTLDGMAGEIHLSRAQFTRRFRAIFGTSPTRFVIRTRLEHARQLLAETEMTLEQIARALGYTDVYFFARQFKQFTGQTPGAIRKRR